MIDVSRWQIYKTHLGYSIGTDVDDPRKRIELLSSRGSHEWQKMVVDAVISMRQERDALVKRVEELESSIAQFPKTCDGFPYVPHEDSRTFFCVVQIGWDEKRWFKTTCTTVNPDEMIDDDQIWTVKITDEFRDWDGESCECLAYVLEANRDAMYEKLKPKGGDNEGLNVKDGE